jgi:Rod binding domain-containing protein
MFDQQMSTELAANGTFGLAQALQHQLNQSPRASKSGEATTLIQSKGFELRQDDSGYALKRASQGLFLDRGNR